MLEKNTQNYESLFKKEDQFLRSLIQKKHFHARWLNTLAFLEHIGSRKIIKSQNSFVLDLELLRHIQEEASHAVFFKTLSLKIAPTLCLDFKEPNLLCGLDASNYFQSLDHFVEEKLNELHAPQNACYLYTTWAIERRAIELYKHYNDLLKDYHFDFHLDLILKQEEQHLKDTVSSIEKLDSKWNCSVLIKEFETRSYSRLLNKWVLSLEE